MTDNFRNASDQALRYRAPQMKVVEVNVLGIMCQSPTVNDWDKGSNSDGIDMEE